MPSKLPDSSGSDWDSIVIPPEAHLQTPPSPKDVKRRLLNPTTHRLISGLKLPSRLPRLKETEISLANHGEV
ncbi:hypothetical protein FHG87_019982 [Trinorchestia longiramus]|nr:hypothetical protein FHG87_019982 [Trinorchestia longiramus]